MKQRTDIEERIKRIEAMLAEILAAVTHGRPGRYEYERALQQFSRGDKAALTAYIEKGGKPNGGDGG